MSPLPVCQPSSPRCKTESESLQRRSSRNLNVVGRAPGQSSVGTTWGTWNGGQGGRATEVRLQLQLRVVVERNLARSKCAIAGRPLRRDSADAGYSSKHRPPPPFR